MSLIIPGLGKMTVSSLVPGAVVAAVGAIVFKPLLVGSIRVGYEAVDFAKGAWSDAKVGIANAKHEALSHRQASSMEAELKHLREEVAQLKAKRG